MSAPTPPAAAAARTTPAAITLAQVIERFEPALRQHYGARLLPSHHHALTALKRCRTQFAPRMLAACTSCGEQRSVPHSCGHRACPHCQHHESEVWLERQLRALVTALYDVVGDARTILHWPIGDPHPIGWLRTALGCAFARHCFGTEGPWNALQSAMLAHHPASRAEPTLQPLLVRSMQAMPGLAQACLEAPVPALGDRPMTQVLDPARVSPAALARLEREAGAALWTSLHWRRTEGIRIVALVGLREAERPDTAAQWIARARTWLTTETRAA